MNEFEIRSYPLGELARMYYPDAGGRGALRLFGKDLRESRGLWNALRDVGYKPYTKILTRQQVKVIVRFLGEP